MIELIPCCAFIWIHKIEWWNARTRYKDVKLIVININNNLQNKYVDFENKYINKDKKGNCVCNLSLKFWTMWLGILVLKVSNANILNGFRITMSLRFSPWNFIRKVLDCVARPHYPRFFTSSKFGSLCLSLYFLIYNPSLSNLKLNTQEREKRS